MATSKESSSTLKLGPSRVVKEVLKATWQRITGLNHRSFRLLRWRKESNIITGPRDTASVSTSLIVLPSSQRLPLGRSSLDLQVAHDETHGHFVRTVQARPQQHRGVDAASEVASLHVNAGSDGGADPGDEPLEVSLAESTAQDAGLSPAVAIRRTTDAIRETTDVMAKTSRAIEERNASLSRMWDNFRATGRAIDATNATLEEMYHRSLPSASSRRPWRDPTTIRKKRRRSSWQTIPMLQCTTCEGEPAGDEQFPGVPTSCRDRHEAETCASCWQQWLEAQVSTQSYDQISCIECSSRLNQLDIRRLATKDVFEQYLDAEVKSVMATDSAFIWCPQPSCTSGQLHYGNQIFTCVQCDHKHCTVCRADWHHRETCREYQKRITAEPREGRTELRQRLRREEASTAEMIDLETKLCPGPKCGRRLEKISGCNHVVCPKCKFSFCWLCLASHQKILLEGNTAHRRDCNYHSNNLRISAPFNVP